MRNFSLSRNQPARRPERPGMPPGKGFALAWGPLLGALACNVYDDSLTVSAPLGGSGTGGVVTSAGAAGIGGSPSQQGGASGDAGSTSGVSSSAGTDNVAGSAANVMGGNAGGGGTSAGSDNAGSAAAGGGMGGMAAQDAELVDDMEDDDAGIAQQNGRNGYWYTGSDGTAGGKLTPATGSFTMTALDPGDRSAFAASVKAENFTGWGSNIGFNFFEKSGAQAYDASAFCGLRFWAKAASTLSLRFNVPDVDTHPAGNVCKDPGASGTACYDHFSAPVSFTKAWAQYTFKFADLVQAGTGYHPASGKIDVTKLYAVEWSLPGGQPAKTLQIWIDDVDLLKCP